VDLIWRDWEKIIDFKMMGFKIMDTLSQRSFVPQTLLPRHISIS